MIGAAETIVGAFQWKPSCLVKCVAKSLFLTSKFFAAAVRDGRTNNKRNNVVLGYRHRIKRPEETVFVDGAYFLAHADSIPQAIRRGKTAIHIAFIPMISSSEVGGSGTATSLAQLLEAASLSVGSFPS